jgi:cytochrome c553
MATFPALTPSSRTFTAATYPGAVQLAYSGRESRVRTSNAQTGARFRLSFSALSEAEMLSIRDHYYGQLGRFIPFQLSTELLSGMANPSAVTPTGYQWIYVSSPKVTDFPTGTAAAPSCRHDVELELELVPEVSALVSGANWVALAAMAGGAADSGEILLSGATWSAAAAIAACSGCEAQLVRTALPLDPAMAGLPQAEAWCLGGGEDFELVLALEPVWAEALIAALPGTTRIGELVSGEAGALGWSDGAPWSAGDGGTASSGYSHFS